MRIKIYQILIVNRVPGIKQRYHRYHYSSGKMIHVRDNLISDIKNANRAGIVLTFILWSMNMVIFMVACLCLARIFSKSIIRTRTTTCSGSFCCHQMRHSLWAFMKVMLGRGKITFMMRLWISP